MDNDLLNYGVGKCSNWARNPAAVWRMFKRSVFCFNGIWIYVYLFKNLSL